MRSLRSKDFEKKEYDLHDEVQLISDNRYKYLRVQEWITQEPCVLYKHVYEPNKHKINSVNLTKIAARQLKIALSVNHPELLQKLLIRKVKREISKKAVR